MNSESEKPLIATKPALSESQAITLVENVYGLQVCKVKPLPSYDDQNFYIQTTSDVTSAGNEFILKILNGEDSKGTELIEAQTYVMKFLHEEGLPTQDPIFTKSGHIMSVEAIDYGDVVQHHAVRLLTYLPGTPAAEITATPQILFDIGKMAAILDAKLTKKFQHPYEEYFNRREFLWNLSNTPFLRKYLYAVTDENLRERIEEVIGQFESSVQPNLKLFRKCIHHGDFNDYNILLQKSNTSDGNTTEQYQVSGILDFCDMSYGYYVFEVSITIMYMMIESKDPLPVGGYVLAGYESVIPLTREEKEAIFTLVCSRFAQSLVMARYSVLLCPSNEEYLMITAKTGWKHLITLLDMGKEAIQKIWEETARGYRKNMMQI
ncbi:PREDICTED: hydroxylysine kinase [Nanorana parkeri]|uniref:hydroxylysine kinase n=1 Tax=Nanorana parkeri TaxID=125878 RepID=UPI000853FBC7|nr:PREDICTED: hydroxylysine kinase [Nanorana parkeri]